MTAFVGRTCRKAGVLVLAALALVAAPVAAQSTAPARPVDGDLKASAAAATAPAAAPSAAPESLPTAAPSPVPVPGEAATPPAAAPTPGSGTTYRKDDLIGAATGVFGKGAAGLAQIIQDILKKQGEPNAYIVGREAGGAIGIGVRYGSGTLHHKIEGERPVYWTGPSIGFDIGANAASTFVLVYNLYDTQDIYKRFGAGEGQAYLVGGFHVSYLRRGNIVLIPVRSGAGLRLGINAGWMKLSEKHRWLPL